VLEALLFLQSIKDLSLYVSDSHYGSYSWKPSRFYPNICVSSNRSDKKVIEATDRTLRLVFFVMLQWRRKEMDGAAWKRNIKNAQIKLIGIIWNH